MEEKLSENAQLDWPMVFACRPVRWQCKLQLFNIDSLCTQDLEADE